jgi:hypothetical protein
MKTATHAIICNNNNTFSVALLDGSQFENTVTTYGEFENYYEAFESANADSVERSGSDAVIGYAQVEAPAANVATVNIPANENKDVIINALRDAATLSRSKGYNATGNRYDEIAKFIDQQNVYSPDDAWLNDV